jgi:hypothetical protein
LVSSLLSSETVPDPPVCPDGAGGGGGGGGGCGWERFFFFAVGCDESVAARTRVVVTGLVSVGVGDGCGDEGVGAACGW